MPYTNNRVRVSLHGLRSDEIAAYALYCTPCFGCQVVSGQPCKDENKDDDRMVCTIRFGHAIRLLNKIAAQAIADELRLAKEEVRKTLAGKCPKGDEPP